MVLISLGVGVNIRGIICSIVMIIINDVVLVLICVGANIRECYVLL